MHATSLRLLTVAGAVFAMAGATAGPAAPHIMWQTDLRKAEVAAAKSHKVLMVDFYADW